MEADSRLSWIESRLQHSLKIKIDELKSLFNNEQHLRKLRYFLNVSHCQQLFAYHTDDYHFIFSTECPEKFRGKSILFSKSNSVKITPENIDEEVTSIDLNDEVIGYSETMVREVFLPLVCNIQISIAQNSQDHQTIGHNYSDRMLDLMHRLITNLQVANGFNKGQLILAQPNLDVLQDLLANEKKRSSVLHILESTVINWCKQIKIILHRENIISKQDDASNTPLTEIDLWRSHLDTVVNVQRQLHLPITKEILANLERVDSQYYHSFVNLMIEVSEEKLYSKDMIRYLDPLYNWFTRFVESKSTNEIVALIPALLRQIFLLWKYNKYYHAEENIYRFLRIFSKLIIDKVYLILEDYKHKDNEENLDNFKSALAICAKFRGTYLDTRDMVDEVNRKHEVENADLILNSMKGQMWKTRVYGPHALKSVYRTKPGEHNQNADDDIIDELCLVSTWPARNSDCFSVINSFIQRCNDCLELLQSSEHFRSLSEVAKIGGASTGTLNSMVTEIDNRFQVAVKHLYQKVSDILDLQRPAIFERAFFEFRSVVKDLERALGLIIDQSLDVCPTVEAKLHLIEVFEGISGRDVVQKILAGKLQTIKAEFKAEVDEIRILLETVKESEDLMKIKNVPKLVNQVIVLRGLKERISKPLSQLSRLFPKLLIGDDGWAFKHSIEEVIDRCNQIETNYLLEWNNSISADMADCLRQPILILENSDMEAEDPPQLVINIDARLITTLREIRHLQKIDPDIELNKASRTILRSVEGVDIDLFVRKLNLIVYNFNYAMKSMSIFERNLLSKELEKINELLQTGTNYYSWKMPESNDFIEQLLFLVCTQLGRKLIIIQTNFDEIISIGNSWSRGSLDIFSTCDLSKTNKTALLHEEHRNLEQEIHLKLSWSQSRIKKLIDSTLNVVDINQDSPAWIGYMEFLDAMILESIKNSIITSLSSLQMHVNRDKLDTSPLLSVNLDLCSDEIAFMIPLYATTNRQSLPEIVLSWIQDYLHRSRFIKLINKVYDDNVVNDNDNPQSQQLDDSFHQFINSDEEVNRYIDTIKHVLQSSVTKAATVMDLFNDYSFLWLPKIEQSFQRFLTGTISANQRRSSSRANYRSVEMLKSRGESRTSSIASKLTPAEEEQGERSFLTPKDMKDIEANNIPCLDDFNTEIDLYKTAIEELEAFPEYHDYGCLRVLLDPLRQVLIVYAQSWIWKYSQFLCEQVNNMLLSLEAFLLRVEPQIDSITGEERDTVSFMRLMRVFNEISTQQQVTQNKFTAMNKAVDIVRVYAGNLLTEDIIHLHQTIPERWTNLKTKVGLAKQRIGPRIQAESETVSMDLVDFRDRVDKFEQELHKCEVYNFDCPLEGARVMLNNFDKRIIIVKNEASDLLELQNLLDRDIVNFEKIKRCMLEISALKEVWELNRKIQNEQQSWRKHKWQRINPDFLMEEIVKELNDVDKLPNIVKEWDVWLQLRDSVLDIKICIPLLNDLSNKAMRTRHWKQMVRATGGAIHVDSDALKNMTFGELLNLGLQKHLSDVRTIVDRASQDLKVENSLKTYEEVWLSKIFSFNGFRIQEIVKDDDKKEKDVLLNESREAGSRVGGRSVGGSRMVASSTSKHRSRTMSTVSLPHSLILLLDNIDEALDDDISLITNTEDIFPKLAEHQKSLESMVNDSSSIGSFLDDVLRWQSQLRNIESVLTIWLRIQRSWMKLYQLFSWKEIQCNLSSETQKFQLIHRDFVLLMLATKRNPNVLQCCNRKNMTTFLEDIECRLTECRQAVLQYLSRRNHLFHKLYFLSDEDLFDLIGADNEDLKSLVSLVWPNIAELQISEIESETNFNVCSIISDGGEKMELYRPIEFKESTEATLIDLDVEIRTSLNKQLQTFLSTIKNLDDFASLLSDLNGELASKTMSQILSLGLKILLTKDVEELIKLQTEERLSSLNNLLTKLQSILTELFKLRSTSKETVTSLKVSSCINILTEYIILFNNILKNLEMFLDHWHRYPKFKSEEADERVTVKIEVLECSVDYGFELCSITSSEISLSSFNSCDLVNILSCMDHYSGAICYTDREGLSDIILASIAGRMGKNFCVFDGSVKMNEKEINRAFKLHFLTDSWVCIRNINRLSVGMTNIIEEILILKNTVDNDGGQSKLGERFTVDMTSHGCLFFTQDRLVPRFSSKTNYLKTPVVFSSLNDIPYEMMHYLRLVTIRQMSMANQIQLMLCREGFQNIDQLSTMLTDFIGIIDQQFSTLVDDKDGISVKFLSYSLIHDLGKKISKSRYQLANDDQLGNIELEKSMIISALKEEFQQLLSTGKRDNFLKLLTDFWSISDGIHNTSIMTRDDHEIMAQRRSIYDQVTEHLMPTDNMESHVLQILNSLGQNKATGVVGSTGSGKSTFINVALEMRRQINHVEIVVEKIYPDSYSDSYPLSKEHRYDLSLIQTVLARFSKLRQSQPSTSMVEYCLVVDGYHSMDIIESLSSCLTERHFVLSNGNRVTIPPSLHIVFEIESVGDIHPGLVTQVTLIHCKGLMSDKLSQDWKIPFAKLLKSCPNKEVLSDCLDHSITRLLKYVDDCFERSVVSFSLAKHSSDTKVVPLIRQSNFGCLSTLANYMKSMMSPTFLPTFDEECCNKLLAYSAIWAFGGFIKNESKPMLSDAVKEIYNLNIPIEYQQYSLFDLHLDTEKMQWHPWSDTVTSNVLTKDRGLALDRVVKTATIEACNANLNLLSDNGFAVMLIGDRGSGKTALIKERLKSLCSGEVAEILNVSVELNIYTRTNHIAKRLNANLQWQHGNIYTPTGNKKLIVFLDDFNAPMKNYDGVNSVNEFARELLDSGTFWCHRNGEVDDRNDTDSQFDKKIVKNVNMITTLNTDKLALHNKRVLRHFSIVHLATGSADEQTTIFSILFKGHVFGSATGKSETSVTTTNNNCITPLLIDQLVKVTVDLQERLNHQFQSMAKPPHYYFNLHSLVQFFYNMCQSVSSNTDLKTFLHLWKNECFWTYYYRLIDPVHVHKYEEIYEKAIKGEFAEKYKAIELPLQVLLDSNVHICSSIQILDTGLVTTNSMKLNQESRSGPRLINGIAEPSSSGNDDHRSGTSTEATNQQCSYMPIKNIDKITDILKSALNEYNKIYPPINIHLHRNNVNILSRLSRVLTLNHNMGHCLIVSDGSPGLSTTLLKLSAHIAGYRVANASPKILESYQYSVDEFKGELNTIFTNTGSKGEKTVLLIKDNDLSIVGVTQCIRDFIINMSIDDLFSIEEKTHIINAVRTEVVRSGLNYSRDVAWKFFIQNVVRNFRFAIIVNDCHSASFHAWMQRNNQLMAKMNILWNTAWTKQELINNSRHIIDHYGPLRHHLSDNVKENCCYLLQSVHMTSQEFDFSKHHFNDSDPIDRLGLAARNRTNNTTFERFVVKFCQLLEKRLSVIEKEDVEIKGVLSVIDEQEQLATRLYSQLTHEKQVLQDKINAATSILNQIGENTVIVQTQMKTIQAQINEITQLKKLVPDYKLAHERYLYKSIDAFNQAREVIKNLDIDNLTELRSTHNPIVEVSELIGTIIMIVKSPTVDMTWNTGGKRLLANLERFTLELLTFDDREISDDTLAILEPLLKKSSMQPDIIMEKSKMSSCRDLCKWVHHVTRYYKIRQTKVTPLHQKLDSTARKVADAEVQMKLLDEKRKNLNSRLQDLSNNFEQATFDRYNQEIKSAKVTEMLTTSKNLMELLENEKKNASYLRSFYKKRKANVIGSSCVTAGFLTYLGRFTPITRRELLTVDWPRCLRERGLNLTFDIMDKSKGLKIVFDYPDLQPEVAKQAMESKDGAESPVENQSVSSMESKVNVQIPILTDPQYSDLLQAMGTFVFDQGVDNNLNTDDLSDIELQQAILLVGNHDRLSIISDPSGHGKRFYMKYWQLFNGPENDRSLKPNTIQIIEANQLNSQQLFSRLEEAVVKSHHVVIETNNALLDGYIESLIQYFSFQTVTNQESDSKFIQIGSRRLTHDSRFRAVVICKEIQEDTELQSQVNLVNWRVTEDQLLDIVSEKCFSFAGNNREKILASKELSMKYHYYLRHLKQELSSILMEASGTKGRLWNDETIDLLKWIIDIINQTNVRLAKHEEFQASVGKHKQKFRKQLLRIELIVQCIKSMEHTNANISLTANMCLEIFDVILMNNGEVEFKDLNAPGIDDGSQGGHDPRSKVSVVKIEYSKDREDILKWSVHDELPNFEINDEDDKYLVNELLVSIDNEEKKQLAQDITGVRASKHEMKLKSFEFYMKRRGVTEPIQWKPRHKSNSDDLTVSVRKDERSEISNKLKQIKLIGMELDVDKTNEVDNVFSVLSEDCIKTIVATFEAVIINRLKLCLTNDEFKIYRFIYYLWLSEDPINAPNSFELEFFIHGSLRPQMKLSLQDFDCQLPVPNWMSADIWGEVLAASLVPGPLQELAVKVAENSDDWRQWYEEEQDQDDMEWTPLDKPSDQSDKDTSIQLSSNRFIRLILWRIFKPDRCKEMIESISHSRMSKDSYVNDLELIINQSPSVKCIVVTRSQEPSPDQLNVDKFDNNDCFNLINKLSKDKSMSHVSITTMADSVLSSLLDNDSRNKDWIVLTNVEKSGTSQMSIINVHLKKLVTHDNDVKTQCVWIICKNSATCLQRLSIDFLDHLLVISEESLLQMSHQSSDTDPQLTSVLGKVFTVALLAMHSQVNDIATVIAMCPPLSSRVLWNILYLNTIMLLRQVLGCRGITTWKRVPITIFGDQLRYLNSKDLETLKQPEKVDSFIDDLINSVFVKVYFDTTDLAMIHSVASLLFSDLSTNKIVLNGLEIVFPEFDADINVNRESLRQQSWFTDKNLTLLTFTESDSSIAINTSTTFKYIDVLEKYLNSVLQSQNSPKRDEKFDDKYMGKINNKIMSLSINRLRAKTIYVSENLPSIINAKSLNLDDFQFSYNSSTSLTLVSNGSSSLKNKIDHKEWLTKDLFIATIFDEINLYNREICKIRSQLHFIFNTSEEDFIDLPEYLVDICCRLVEEKVPQPWIMLAQTSYVPTTHRLTTYIEYFNKRYTQLQGFYKKIDNMKDNSDELTLQPIWLGGFKKPNAILEGLKINYGLTKNIAITKIKLVAHFSSDTKDHGSELIVKDLFIIGASIDFISQKISVSKRSTVNKLIRMHLRAVAIDDMDTSKYYNCPIYTDESRNRFLNHVFVTTDDPQPLILSGVFIILDMGSNIRDNKKDRIPVLVPPSVNVQESTSPMVTVVRKRYEDNMTLLYTLREEDELTLAVDDAAEPQASTDNSNRTDQMNHSSSDQKSQLSFRPYSPNGPPLPSEMEISREGGNLLQRGSNDVQERNLFNTSEDELVESSHKDSDYGISQKDTDDSKERIAEVMTEGKQNSAKPKDNSTENEKIKVKELEKGVVLEEKDLVVKQEIERKEENEMSTEIFVLDKEGGAIVEDNACQNEDNISRLNQEEEAEIDDMLGDDKHNYENLKDPETQNKSEKTKNENRKTSEGENKREESKDENMKTSERENKSEESKDENRKTSEGENKNEENKKEYRKTSEGEYKSEESKNEYRKTSEEENKNEENKNNFRKTSGGENKSEESKNENRKTSEGENKSDESKDENRRTSEGENKSEESKDESRKTSEGENKSEESKDENRRTSEGENKGEESKDENRRTSEGENKSEENKDENRKTSKKENKMEEPHFQKTELGVDNTENINTNGNKPDPVLPTGKQSGSESSRSSNTSRSKNGGVSSSAESNN